ncbi:TIGR03086 family metal-binding protein [Nocardioides sp. LHG3406-4]|uniref:TIGR03086 family metal-binding protein n=1 Tax=Nocardioides sp. LHG3406-4 TaxID=2804575 RepID=UPI003CF9BFC4
MIDLTPTTDRTRAVAAAVTDQQLEAVTPTGSTVAQLLHHVLGLSVAFRDAAAKLDGPTTSTPPGPVSEPLPDDWRDRADRLLAELAAAWRDAGAWEGMTRAGGVELPGEIGGLVALDEVLLHGWDLARATGQPYEPSDAECEAVLPIVEPEADDPDGSGREGMFGRVVEVPEDAPLWHRVLGLSGRDPGWTA